jgi:hypothetical protein
MRGQDIKFGMLVKTQSEREKARIDRVLSYMEETLEKYRDQWSIKKNHTRISSVDYSITKSYGEEESE